MLTDDKPSAIATAFNVGEKYKEDAPHLIVSYFKYT